MEKFNQEISALIYELFELKINELCIHFGGPLKNLDWSTDEGRDLAYVTIESFRNILSDCIDNTKTKIIKKSGEFNKSKEKEFDLDRTSTSPASPKRRAPTEVRE